MGEIINKLQVIARQSPNFTEEQKKEYFGRFEAMKSWRNEDVEKNLESLLEDAEKDPGAIKTFFDQIDEVMKIFVTKGIAGLKKKVNQIVEETKSGH